MINPIQSTKDEITKLILDAYTKSTQNNELPTIEIGDFVIEIPNDKGFGDFASNFAMQYAKQFKTAPRKVAETIVKFMDFTGSDLSKCEIAGPGFMNFYVDNKWFSDVLVAIENEKAEFGKSKAKNPQKIMVEFVSANPTGPMHMGNARGGALGDCLAELLAWAGNDVSREFYVNDAGNQIEKFYLSLNARYFQKYCGEENYPFPEDGYHGEDIKERIEEFSALHGDKYIGASEQERRDALISYGLNKNIERIKKDLTEYRIQYDNWFYESTLHNGDELSVAIETLKKNGYTYEKDDALWYKATEFGAEKDEVLIRANGFPTYFAADIAYHHNKLVKRGFDKAINIWGADHHGHVARLKGAMTAIGIDSTRLDIILIQLVRLMQEGKPVKMSKRTGKSITLKDLLIETSVDAARFFFNMRAADSHFDFDLDLAVEQSSQNPVFYVQYAFARISSILRLINEEGITIKPAQDTDLTLLAEPEEIDLIRLLASFPEEIKEAAKDYDPSKITRYSIDVAALFHKFYNACRVKNDNAELMNARLVLCNSVKTVLKNCLDLLKVNAPEKM